MTPEELAAFEEDIASEYNAGRIKAPVHLESGNEDQLIEVFKSVGPNDWIACSWRSHLKALLRGVPPDVLKAEIMAGRSISICLPQYRVISSAMVGGILPIALGIAFAIKRAGSQERVHCWMGDMTSLTGIAQECMMYAAQWELPIRWLIEDNHKSVCTDTYAVWNISETPKLPNVTRYSYESKWPHAGAGKRIQF